MRISGLAARTGVPVATIKYYLREGLLPPGEATSATQAQYGDDHLARLRLVRALLEVGRLSVASTREVLAAMESEDLFEALGRAQQELPPRVPEDVDVTDALARVSALGWLTDPGSTAMRQLAVALRAAQEVGLPIDEARFSDYARAAYAVAVEDVAGVPQTSPADALAYAVVGTVLYEPILLALRRLAHQQVSAARFAVQPPP